MGNRAFTTVPSTEVHEYVRALNQKLGYQYLEKLGGGKVVKTCLCRYKGEGNCILIVYAKPAGISGSDLDARLGPFISRLEEINETVNLFTHPGVITRRFIHETKQALYFSRQYFAFNLFDRFHVRPFFSQVDKHWIAYQLLQATYQLHKSGIHHGGIKCENILTTTWNWLFVTDISFYKPVYLPADNPSTYNTFFDTEKQRTVQACYLAPERFYDSNVGSPLDSKLTEEMDIFAVGCCIAEIFLEGSVIFDYSQMLRYRMGDYSPEDTLKKIGNPHVRAIIRHMIQLDPKKRLKAEQYLGIAECEGEIGDSIKAIFPPYFEDMYHLLKKLLDPSFADPDRKVKYLHRGIDSIITLMFNESTKVSEKKASSSSSSAPSINNPLVSHSASESTAQGTRGKLGASSPLSTASPSWKRSLPSSLSSERRASPFTTHASSPSSPKYIRGKQDIDRVIRDLELFVESASCDESATAFKEKEEKHDDMDDDVIKENKMKKEADEQGRRAAADTKKESTDSIPTAALTGEEEEAKGKKKTTATGTPSPQLNGLAILVAIVGASIQSLVAPSNKVKALDILEKVVRYSEGSMILDLIIPHALYLRSDPQAIVRYKVVNLLALAMDKVDQISMADANVLSDYLLPIIVKLHPDHEKDPLVQIAICKKLPVLMRSTRKFLDLTHALKQKAAVALDSKESSYDKELHTIKLTFLNMVVGFLAMGSSKAKIALLKNFLHVCEFLGKALVEEKEMLMHLTTVLNEPDWELRASMFRHVPKFSVFLGQESLVVDSLLPIMTEALYDAELFVSHEALKALTSICCFIIAKKNNRHKGPISGRIRNGGGFSPPSSSPSSPSSSSSREAGGLRKEIIEKVAPLLLHPAHFIHREACKYMLKLAEALGPAQSFQRLHPILKKYTTYPVLVLNEETLSQALRPCIPLSDYNEALSLYSKTPKADYKQLKTVAYFKDLGTSEESDEGALLRDMKTYFFEVFKKSAHIRRSHNGNLGSPQGRGAAGGAAGGGSSPTSGARMRSDWADAGRRAKLYATSLEPTADIHHHSISRSGSKRSHLADKQGDIKRLKERRKPGDYSSGGRDPPPGAVDVVNAAFDIPIYDDIEIRNRPNTWYRRRVRQCLEEDEKVRPEMRGATWVPKGILVGEVRHAACVNEVEVAKDSSWMVSGSSDGTMKIWNIANLAKARDSFAISPDITYRKMAGRVVGVTVCEGTNRVAGVSDKGSVHVFTVDAGQDHRFKETKPRILSTKGLGSITTVTHADTLSKSLLIYGTHTGSVYCWDFRREREAFKLDLSDFTGDSGVNSIGMITASSVGPSGYSLFVGTSQGIVVLWDLRYQLATSVWQHSSKAPIQCLAVASGDAIPAKAHTTTKAPLLLISVKGIDEVSAFCVLTGVCRAVFKVIGTSFFLGNMGNWTKIRRSPKSSSLAVRRSPANSKDSLQSFPRKNHRSSVVNPLSLPALRVYDLRFSGFTDRFGQELSRQVPQLSSDFKGINAFLLHERRGLFTAGQDHIIRFWHLQNLESSRRITRDFIGPYSTRYSRRIENSTPVYEEQLLRHLDASHDQATTSRKARRLPKGPMSTAKSHKARITDLKAIEHPMRLLVSADARGVIKVWR